MTVEASGPLVGVDPLRAGAPWRASELGERVRTLVCDFPCREARTEGLRRAAVALLLLPDEEGRLCFVLTRRSPSLRSHAGQWALPGGKVDAGETVIEAALRELEEELGARLELESVLGRLDDYATRSGFLISPVVLWSPQRLRFEPDPQEVAFALEVPLESFDRADVPRLRPIPESDRPVIALPVGDSWVHAPTAAVVYQLFELIRGRCHRVDAYEEPVFAWR
ncbi:MAG TPA: CoA pyrophosphatase [Thermoanaerobaculia bacterium]|nr:CoA pyrophosphatase [Thermoanaerobaculia bacterium]